MTQIPHDLMTAILDNPDDDLPRLIAADWLEEHGESERAEFIRVQIELAILNSNGQDPWPRRRQLETKEGILFRKLGLNGFKYRVWHFAGDKPESAETQCFATWRRGFPHSVRCTMADFMPGECRECDGKGDYLHPTHCRQPCKLCHGTGKHPGLARVVGGWPVTKIEFTDRQPMKFLAWHGYWRWLHVDYANENTPQGLPSELYKLLKWHGRGWGHDNTEAFYPTREIALSALSDAAVRHARGEWEASTR